jgi:hypothetical protein
MKCEVCLDLLEEYLDGELPSEERKRVDAHVMTCAECSESFAALTAEQELFARYDREIEVPPFLWTRVAAHTVAENNKPKRSWFERLFARPAAAIAMMLLAMTVGVVYLISRAPIRKSSVVTQVDPTLRRNATDPIQVRSPTPAANDAGAIQPSPRQVVAVNQRPKHLVRPAVNHTPSDQSDVLSSDLTYLDMDEQDTAKHIEQTQNLLRSIKNVSVSDGEEEIDVTYDKALSRRLLNENVVLRRDAEMKAKFPTKTLLADLEPFLIDIANLPDRARPEDVRAIKERVQKTEIVAALLDYQDRGSNNR